MVKLLLFLVLTISTSYTNGSIIDVIEDLIEFYEQKFTISDLSCNKKTSMELFKMLSKKGKHYYQHQNFKSTLIYPHSNNYIYILNLFCKHAEDIVNKANEQNVFFSSYKWILYYEEKYNRNNKIPNLNKLNNLVSSDVTIVQFFENNTSVLSKIYKRHFMGPVITEDFGFWSFETRLKTDNFEKITSLRRRNLQGTNLNVCMVITHNDSLNHLTDKRDRHIDSIAKVNYVLVQHLSNIINASLNYSIQSTWGYKNNKSEWSGMIGELTRNEADIGGTPLFLTSDRVNIIQYIAMTTPTRSKFIFRQPKLSYVRDVYTLPFATSVWHSTLASLLVISIVLYCSIKWEWFKKDRTYVKEHPNEIELEDSCSDVILLSFGAFCQQGASSTPFSTPGRITVLVLFLSFMFLYTSYSANIVALLQSSSHSIQSLEDLLKSRLQVGVDDTVFNRYYFPNATEPVRRALYLQKVAPPGKPSTFMPIEEGVRKIRNGLFAFHMETGPGYKIVSETFEEGEKCGLQEIQFLQVPDPWLAIQKNSSYKEMLKIGLHLIQETGLQSREVSLIYTKKPPCISRGATFISVGIVDCYPPAVVLVGGIVASAVIFILEKASHYRKNQRNGAISRKKRSAFHKGLIGQAYIE